MRHTYFSTYPPLVESSDFINKGASSRESPAPNPNLSRFIYSSSGCTSIEGRVLGHTNRRTHLNMVSSGDRKWLLINSPCLIMQRSACFMCYFPLVGMHIFAYCRGGYFLGAISYPPIKMCFWTRFGRMTPCMLGLLSSRRGPRPDGGPRRARASAARAWRRPARGWFSGEPVL